MEGGTVQNTVLRQKHQSWRAVGSGERTRAVTSGGPPGFSQRLRAFAGVEAWKWRCYQSPGSEWTQDSVPYKIPGGTKGCTEPWSAIACPDRYCCRFQGDWLRWLKSGHTEPCFWQCHPHMGVTGSLPRRGGQSPCLQGACSSWMALPGVHRIPQPPPSVQVVGCTDASAAS